MSEGFGAQFIVAAHTTINCGLPPPPTGPQDVNAWYAEVQRLPVTRVSGWFGCTIGTPQDEHDVQLFFYDGENHLDPKLRLVAGQDDLVRIWEAIGILIRDRKLGSK